MDENICIVTDKVDYIMSLETSEKLKSLELETYEKRFCIEDETVCCYMKGTRELCQEFVNNLNDKELIECLIIKCFEEKNNYLSL